MHIAYPVLKPPGAWNVRVVGYTNNNDDDDLDDNDNECNNDALTTSHLCISRAKQHS